MKKIFFSIMTLALSCALLCACGSMDADRPRDTDTPLVTASPDPRDDVPMPDNSVGTDGNVDDRDGIIDDGDSTGGMDDEIGVPGTSGITDNNTATGNTAVTSPIPTATAKP